jgi:hypothetical protein
MSLAESAAHHRPPRHQLRWALFFSHHRPSPLPIGCPSRQFRTVNDLCRAVPASV